MIWSTAFCASCTARWCHCRLRRPSFPHFCNVSIDNKRKHLERSLSAVQRDKILINEAKEDAMFRKEMTEAMKESTRSFSDSVERLSSSLEVMANSIGNSIEKLAQAMCYQQPVNQNMFYQKLPPRHQQQFYHAMLNGFDGQLPSNSTNFNQQGPNRMDYPK